MLERDPVRRGGRGRIDWREHDVNHEQVVKDKGYFKGRDEEKAAETTAHKDDKRGEEMRAGKAGILRWRRW